MALREVLGEVCGQRGALDGKRLGHYLKKHKNRVFGGLALREAGRDGRMADRTDRADR